MAAEEIDNPNHTRMSLGDHLEELRRRLFFALGGLVVAMAASLTFGKRLIGLLSAPYDAVLAHKGIDAPLAAFTVTDGFFTYFRVSLLAGLLAASPWIVYQLWRFISVGLYPREKRYVYLAVPFCAGLFICGALFFLTLVSYPMLRFFMVFTVSLDVKPVIHLKGLIAFMTSMMLVFGLAFQTPVVVLLLARVRLVEIATFRKYRRHVIVAMLVLAAAMTSPSPIDQVALAVPMWLLYELGILLARIFAAKEGE